MNSDEFQYLLPSIAGISTLFVGGSLLYSKIRQIIPIKVNCWFCNGDLKVLWKNKNSFVCSNCHQYNGFNEDGDYNCDIPAQSNENLNYLWGKCSPKQKVNQNNAQNNLSNGLCEICNLNQVLKVRALSEFSPVDVSNYDAELEEFGKRLEDIYRLCRQCEAVLHQTLGKQDSWIKPKLISWRIEHSKRFLIKGISSISRNSFIARISYFILFLLSLILSFICFDELKIISSRFLSKLGFPIDPYYYFLRENFILCRNLGFFISFLITIYNGMETMKKSDAFCCFCWFMFLTSSSFRDSLPNNSFLLIQLVCSLSTLISTIWTATSPPRDSPLLKKSKRITERKNHSFDQDLTYNSSFERSPNLNKSHSLDNESPLHYYDSNSYENVAQPKDSETTLQNQDLGTTLDSLKISTPQKRDPSENFNPKSLFTEKENCKPYRDSLLTPSRLSNKIVTQSSWVAGGYWGNTGSPRRLAQNNISQFDEVKRPLFSLSRSSSQSSGFISHISGRTSSEGRNPFQSVPNSCRSSQSSLCGDRDTIERQSVLSEPVFNSWNSSTPIERAPSVDSVKSRKFGSFDAQSACSNYSQLSSASHHPTSAYSNVVYYNPAQDSSHSPKKEERVLKDTGGFLKYCNPGLAFILGLSVSANVFFFLILFKIDPFINVN